MRVKIISGTYGYKPDPKRHVTPVPAGGAVEVSEQEAARLVALGIAAYPHGEPPERPADEVPEYSAGMRADQLRALLEQHGVPYTGGMSKAGMVAALDEYFAQDGGEAPPQLSAEGPVG